MQDFIHANVMSQEIERSLRDKQLRKFDPDGLAQYEIWDNAFSKPTLVQRVKNLFPALRGRRQARQEGTSICHTTECLPQN